MYKYQNLAEEEANIMSLQAEIVTRLSIKFSSVLSGKVNIVSNLLLGFMTSVEPCYLREIPTWKKHSILFLC